MSESKTERIHESDALDEQEGKLQASKDLGELGEELCTSAVQRAYDPQPVFMQWKNRLLNSEEEENIHA